MFFKRNKKPATKPTPRAVFAVGDIHGITMPARFATQGEAECLANADNMHIYKIENDVITMLPPFGYVHTPCDDKVRSEESVLARIQTRVVGINMISETQARAEGIII